MCTKWLICFIIIIYLSSRFVVNCNFFFLYVRHCNFLASFHPNFLIEPQGPSSFWHLFQYIEINVKMGLAPVNRATVLKLTWYLDDHEWWFNEGSEEIKGVKKWKDLIKCYSFILQVLDLGGIDNCFVVMSRFSNVNFTEDEVTW